jgi:anthranilate phosphoribosyltransferase/anthranilate synthase/phosphoribosyltransferase
MILLIDNYDSFTYNLYQILGKFSNEVKVLRNDEVTLAEIQSLNPEAIVISPGPGRPEEAGICIELIQAFYKQIPILGICLGHQAIVSAFGGEIQSAKSIMHGKTSQILHSNKEIFRNIQQKSPVMRYHSLSAVKEQMPPCLEIIASAYDDGEVMAVKHSDHCIFGIQFHPESICTENGEELIRNFLSEAIQTESLNFYLRKITKGIDLTEDEAYLACKAFFQEDTTDSEMAAFLIALKLKNETTDEMLGLVRALKEQAMYFSKDIRGVIDNCGTGGDLSSSFNISTTTAFVLAGAGLKVAKNGNRSVSSKSGSADVLENLGVNITCSSEKVTTLLSEVGVAFLYAPHVHPQLKRVMRVRRELNIPTIFNFIGPLTNPVQLDYQVLGVYKREMVEPIAHVLNRLGRKRAIVINGCGNLDEASLQGDNFMAIVSDGIVTTKTIHPSDLGLMQVSNEAIRGGSPSENAEILLRVLQGEEGAYRDNVLFNAAIGLFVGGVVDSIQEGITVAKESIDSGKALQKLRSLVRESNLVKESV